MLARIKALSRRSALGKLLLSYLLVLTIPLCGLAINFIYSNRAIKKEVYASNKQVLDSAALRADDALYQLAYTAQKVCGSDVVMKQVSLQNNMRRFYWQLPDTISVINALEKTIYSEEILVYLHNSGYLINHNTANPVRTLGVTMQYIKGSSYTPDEFTDAMSAVSYTGRYEINDIYTYNRVNTELLTYLLTYNTPNRTLDKRDMSVFVSMPVDTLMELCGFSGEQTGTFIVLDDNYRVILQSDEELTIPDNLHRYLDGDGQLSLKIGNENIWAAYRIPR